MHFQHLCRGLKIHTSFSHLGPLNKIAANGLELNATTSQRIPQSLRNLSFQGHLNLSYNDFKGMIPLSTQLQSFLELPFSRTAHKRKTTTDPNRRKTEIVMSLEPLSSLAWELALLLVSG
ncbi:hypothetical protein HN51_067559 [Arachis hypogaea]